MCTLLIILCILYIKDTFTLFHHGEQCRSDGKTGLVECFFYWNWDIHYDTCLKLYETHYFFPMWIKQEDSGRSLHTTFSGTWHKDIIDGTFDCPFQTKMIITVQVIHGDDVESSNTLLSLTTCNKKLEREHVLRNDTVSLTSFVDWRNWEIYCQRSNSFFNSSTTPTCIQGM